MSAEPEAIETKQAGADNWPVFMCYRQSDGRRVAERLFALLGGLIVLADGTALGNPPQLDIYFDQAAPGVADWRTVHEPYLKRARAFILVCTPGSKLFEGEEIGYIRRSIRGYRIDEKRRF